MATPSSTRELNARTTTPSSTLELRTLARDLSSRERGQLRTTLLRLLRFQRTLVGWPAALRAPAATPIVAVYVRGAMRGCALERGTRSGGEKLARAFLGATAHVRDEREIAIELSYPRCVRWLEDPNELDIGTEGIALVRRGAVPVLLMPQVSRDHRVDTRGLLALLADKARVPAHQLADGARFAAWTVDRIVARLDDDVEQRSARAAARDRKREEIEQGSKGAVARDADYAAAWLARMIDARGQIAFAIDARARVLQPDGELWHARSAIAIEALAAHGGYASTVARARRWLGAEVARAMRGERVVRWPEERASIVGTLALACLAGVPAHERLRNLVADERWRDLTRAPGWPWHAAQVASALGRETPLTLWDSCLAGLTQHPFAPYVALAARAMGDETAHRRATAAVAGFIHVRAPHKGGARATALPETGLTAVAAHALAGAREHRRAHAAALAFVRARQLLPDRIPAPLDPTLALGGFTSSPVDDVLRADITGHCLLALAV